MSGRKRTQVVLYDDDHSAESTSKKRTTKSQRKQEIPIINDEYQPLPKRNKAGYLVFEDYPEFRPNLTPAEVIQKGSFGGTYFRPIYSSVTDTHYREVWKELPSEWFEGLDVEKMVSSPVYDASVNKYGVQCGQGLEEWENSGWITPSDPYGNY